MEPRSLIVFIKIVNLLCSFVPSIGNTISIEINAKFITMLSFLQISSKVTPKVVFLT